MRTIQHAIVLLLSAVSILPCVCVSALPTEPDYPCYIRTVSGRIVDLTSVLCSSGESRQGVTPVAVTPMSTAAPVGTQKSAIEFAGIEFGFQRIAAYGIDPSLPLVAKGQITNRTGNTITIATITAKQGNNIVQIEANTQVKPGETATFEKAGSRGRPKRGIIDDVVSWDDLYGQDYTDGFAGCQYVSNVDENEKRCKYH